MHKYRRFSHFAINFVRTHVFTNFVLLMTNFVVLVYSAYTRFCSRTGCEMWNTYNYINYFDNAGQY